MNAFSFHQILQSADIYLKTSDSIWFTDESRIVDTTMDIDTLVSTLTNASSIALSHESYSHWIQKLLYLSEFIQPTLFIFAETDIAFTQDNIQDLLDSYPNAEFLISNFIGNHPRCKILPLGNRTFVSLDNNITKDTMVCIPFCTPNSQDRVEFYNFINKNPFFFSLCVPQLPENEYNKTLSKCYFTICCCGNGFDTYRFWECLCNKSIPIVKNNIYFKRLKIQYPRLPFVYIDSWSDLFNLVQELTVDFYNETWNNGDISCIWSGYWQLKYNY